MSGDNHRWRLNVAAVILDDTGNVLLARRKEDSRYLHFPQGGVRDGETYEEAVKREVQEEVGILPSSYRVLARLGGLRYRYGDKNKKRKEWEGQQQTWFLLQCFDDQPHVDCHGSEEFDIAAWMPMEQLDVSMFAPFKQDVVRKVLEHFLPSPGQRLSAHLQQLDMAKVYRFRPDRPFPDIHDRRFYAGGKEEMEFTMAELALRIGRAQRRLDLLTRTEKTPALRMLVLACGPAGSRRKSCIRRVASCCDPLLTRAFRPEWQPEEYDLVALQQYPAEGEIRIMCRRMQDRNFTLEQIARHEMQLADSGVRLLHFHLHPPGGEFQEPDTLLPCYMVPCEKRWYRDFVITNIIAETLENLVAESEKILALRK